MVRRRARKLLNLFLHMLNCYFADDGDNNVNVVKIKTTMTTTTIAMNIMIVVQ